MKYIVLPVDAPAASQSPKGREGVVRRLSFYLAMEEYVARHTDEPDCFFMWQVKPSVIFGRNQVMQNEVNVDYCREHGIEMYRRKSGGGCVYADEGNIMLSYITKEENSQQAFYTFVNMILLVLHKMGITATSTSHNDILVEGKKVSGTACYQVHGHNIVHGTLLYDTNMNHSQRREAAGEGHRKRAPAHHPADRSLPVVYHYVEKHHQDYTLQG